MNRGLYPGWNRAANGVVYPAQRLVVSGAFASSVNAGAEFSGSLTVDGGLWPYRASLSGSPPPELRVSPVLVDGARWKIAAAGYGATGGAYSFGVVVTSADGQVVTSTQSVSVNADATFSPTNKSVYIALSGSNMTAERSSGAGYASVRATGKMFAANKTQCEFVITSVGPSPFAIVGIDDGTADISAIFQIASDTHGYGYYQDTGQKIYSNVLATYGASFKTDGDVITMLYDGPSGTLAFKKNGISQGVAYTGLSGDFFPAVAIYSGGGSPSAQITLRTNPAAMSYPESGYVGVLG